jgi:hypothetical protein
MDPARADQIQFLSDDKWDLRPGEEAGLPFRLEDVISIFANAAGDPLCIDTATRQPETAGIAWRYEGARQGRMLGGHGRVVRDVCGGGSKRCVARLMSMIRSDAAPAHYVYITYV